MFTPHHQPIRPRLVGDAISLVSLSCIHTSVISGWIFAIRKICLPLSGNLSVASKGQVLLCRAWQKPCAKLFKLGTIPPSQTMQAFYKLCSCSIYSSQFNKTPQISSKICPSAVEASTSISGQQSLKHCVWIVCFCVPCREERTIQVLLCRARRCCGHKSNGAMQRALCILT